MAFLFPRTSFGPGRCGPAITRTNDFAPLFSLFDDSLNELQRASRQGNQKAFHPRFDVNEVKDAYEVEADVPGIDQKDISIEFVDEHTLTVKGNSERQLEPSNSDAVEASSKPAITEAEAESASEKSHQPTVEDEDAPAAAATPASSSEVGATTPAAAPAKSSGPKYWISERRAGNFARSFRFDARIDQDAVKAFLKNGVLSITIPKAAVPESRRVQIE